jgi:fructokinase
MSHFIGLDIGGTKIAGGVLERDGAMLAELVVPTPGDYAALLTACGDLVRELEKKTGDKCSVGVGCPGRVDHVAGSVHGVPNLSCLDGKPLSSDLAAKLGREIRLENDANCLALAEAIDGVGAGYDSVLGLILGTGVGSGFVSQGRLMGGANSLTGEIGHLPLPFREPADGPLVPCACKQSGCINKSISGGGLARLHEFMTGKQADAKAIADLARANDAEALRTLDRYYEVVAKAMVVVLHSFDPAIIVVSGGLSALPGLTEEVPKRWGKYAFVSQPKTQFIPARHGPTGGVRGAAWLWIRGDY